MADYQPQTVGHRVRRERSRLGLSVRTLARLTGLSASYLSRVENGERNLDRRRTLNSVADALGVPVRVLTGQPYEAHTRQEGIVRTAVTDIRDALHGTALGERYDDPARDLDTLRRATASVIQFSADNDFVRFGPLLPSLLTDLHAHAADRQGGVRSAALPALVDVLYAVQWLTKCAGEIELSQDAAERALGAARLMEDPATIGFARFIGAQSMSRAGKLARRRAAALVHRSADDLQPHASGTGPAAEVYGMLHLTAAWSHTVSGDQAAADSHLAEATETARRTGDGAAFQLWFGPSNLALWQVSMAVERGEGGRVGELARAVNPTALRSRERRVTLYMEMGRGLAQEPATRARAVGMLRRAERLAPLRTRMDPFVRQAVESLHHTIGGDDIRAMARRMGIAPN
jgi:transcriptional regulator with XRE-family HTH domain